MQTVIISLPTQHSTQFVQDQLVGVPVAVVAMAGEVAVSMVAPPLYWVEV
jgi:hypothetical protein